MGMVPVCSILSSLPSVGPALARLNWFLSQSRNSIRPGGIALFDAVKVDRGFERHVVVNNKLILISVVFGPLSFVMVVPQHHLLAPIAVLDRGIDRS